MNLKVNMNRIAIYGAGGFAREVAWLAESCGQRVLCFVDDNPAHHGRRINDIPVMSLEEAAGRFTGSGMVSAIGDKLGRKVQAGCVVFGQLVFGPGSTDYLDDDSEGVAA